MISLLSPLLMTPPAAVVGGLFGSLWLGLIAVSGGTFVLIRNSLRAGSNPNGKNLQAAVLTLAFCAFWMALSVGLILGITTLVMPADLD